MQEILVIVQYRMFIEFEKINKTQRLLIIPFRSKGDGDRPVPKGNPGTGAGDSRGLLEWSRGRL